MALSIPDFERVLAAAGAEDLDSLQIVTTARLAAQHYPQLDPGRPVLVTALAAPALAVQARQVLLAAYPPEHQGRLIDGEEARVLPLGELGEGVAFGPAACLFLPPLPEPGSYEALQEIVARLRAPDGCPWDRELTWEKLRALAAGRSLRIAGCPG